MSYATYHRLEAYDTSSTAILAVKTMQARSAKGTRHGLRTPNLNAARRRIYFDRLEAYDTSSTAILAVKNRDRKPILYLHKGI